MNHFIDNENGNIVLKRKIYNSKMTFIEKERGGITTDLHE